MDTKSFPLELKNIGEDGTFEGKLSVYGVVDFANEIVEPGAFTKTLREGDGELPLHWAHDLAQPIGSLKLADTPTALLTRGRLVLEVPKAREAYALMKAGVVRGLSIGYKTIKSQMTENGIRRLKEIRLFEGSLVSVPCNPMATVTSVKQQESADDLEAVEAFRNAARDLQGFYDSIVNE